MISKFFAKRRSQSAPASSVPAGQRIYAIGDIHGRLDLLDDLLDLIARDEATRGGTPATLIFLGDLVDRGPHSAQVVERLMRLEQAGPGMRFLLGNHEEVFLKALAGEQGALPLFNRIGGRETALSYGISEADYQASDYNQLAAMLQQAVPPSHIEFLNRFEDLIIIGDYAFVHAGVRPGIPLVRQRTSDLRWIRNEFLEHDGPHEKHIVHGHTIAPKVEVEGYRIGLDTGAYMSGTLSAMGFEGDQRWILQT